MGNYKMITSKLTFSHSDLRYFLNIKILKDNTGTPKQLTKPSMIQELMSIG